MDISNTGNQWRWKKYIWAGILIMVLLASMMGCRLQPEEEQKVQQASDDFWQRAQTQMEENTVVFSNDNNSYCVTTQEGGEQANCVTTEKDFSKKLKKIGLTKKKAFQEYCITEIFLHQERIYFWLKEEKEKQIRSTDAEMCLLSAPVSDLSQLRNESAVTNYLHSWESEATSVDTISDDIAGQEMYLFKPNRMEGVVEDKVILSGIRHLGHGISRVDQEYFAAYDPVSNQILELSDIRKVY